MPAAAEAEEGVEVGGEPGPGGSAGTEGQADAEAEAAGPSNPSASKKRRVAVGGGAAGGGGEEFGEVLEGLSGACAHVCRLPVRLFCTMGGDSTAA